MIHSKLFPSPEVLTIKLRPSTKMSLSLSLGTTEKWSYFAMTNSSKTTECRYLIDKVLSRVVEG